MQVLNYQTISSSSGNYWRTSVTAGRSWVLEGNSNTWIRIGREGSVNPWKEASVDCKAGRDRYSYIEEGNMIRVDKGSPSKARYAIFYAVNEDPVIFCRIKREVIKEVRKLLERKDVDHKSVRIFGLIGGARAVKKTERTKNLTKNINAL